ncbi:hypothetical protein GCM10010123_23540 [Pilimelia anulata]|uniref:Uncharacterized protein n=2 Tax=Pilimelia anulata TaxID=53371 RepID=A0A8J3B3I7_9ACTN|nr:hypothetical protein GCM10010123_23540 [Pilimelia anulata]
MTVDELYLTPPDRFVAARTAAAAAARTAGDPAGARELAALRRPTVAAWLVNHLALRDPDAVAALDPLADRLRAAQRARDGDALRDLAGERRRVVGGLVRRAAALAVEAGAARPAAGALAEVEATLQAALLDGEVAAAVRTGRLQRSASHSGFTDVPRPALHAVPDPPAPADRAAAGGERAPAAPDRTTRPRAVAAPAEPDTAVPAAAADGAAPAPAPTAAADGAVAVPDDAVVTPAAAAGDDEAARDEAARDEAARAAEYDATLAALTAARRAEDDAARALADLDARLGELRRAAERLQHERLAAVTERDRTRRDRREIQARLGKLD